MVIVGKKEKELGYFVAGADTADATVIAIQNSRHRQVLQQKSALISFNVFSTFSFLTNSI